MFTIIGGDGKEYGPASTEQIRAWLKGGRANLSTKAKALGTDEWRPLGDFAEFGTIDDTTTASVEPPPLSAPAGDVHPKTYAADLIARAQPLDVFGCLDRSFCLWKANFFPLVGGTLLILLLQMALGLIPILGSIAGLFLNGVFYGGLYYYYLGKMRGQPREVGDVFAGFSRAFVPLMLASLLITVLTLAVVLPFVGPLVYGFVKAAFLHGHPPAVLPSFSPLALLSAFVGFLLLLYLSLSWAFTFTLIIDKKLAPWAAMEVSRRVVTKQWFRVFFVTLLGAILALLGLIGLFIGVLFTLPLMLGAMLYAYEDLCNPPPKNPNG